MYDVYQVLPKLPLAACVLLVGSGGGCQSAIGVGWGGMSWAEEIVLLEDTF